MDGPGATNLYDYVGGSATCRRLAEAFYARIPRDPVLRRVYPASSHCAVNALTSFFTQIFGGPNVYSESRFWLSLREAHGRFLIGQAERDAWVRNMAAAMNDIGMKEPERGILTEFFDRSSTYLINYPDAGASGTAASPKEEAQPLGRDLEQRWQVHQLLDEIVAAVRRKDAKRVMDLAESPTIQDLMQHDRAAFVSVLAELARSGLSKLTEYVRGPLMANPELVRERFYYGRTLLHDAAANGNFALVELLLDLGADPNAGDEVGHTPLYCAGNQKGNVKIVFTLVDAGADVNTYDRIKRCTALHMAARRGNVPIARALLDCGADIEARDRNGETPLRRAVNCGKPEAAAFLLSRGADPNSKGSKGLTPRQAARTAAMKRLFEPIPGDKDSLSETA